MINEYRQRLILRKHGDKIWFIHEMTHVWQYQLGYSVKWHGLLLAIGGGYTNGSAYDYDEKKDSSKTFPDFNMEQQGDLIAHYFAAKYLDEIRHKGKINFLEHMLADFLKDPKNAALLPK